MQVREDKENELKTKTNHAPFVQLGASNHSGGIREINDFYATEPKAVELLMELERFDKNILEPCCGMGHISEILKKHGYNITSSDLIDRNYGIGGVNFLTDIEKWDGDIITNPPYKQALEFVEHAIKIIPEGNKVAMFLKIQFIETKSRREFFKEHPPRVVWISSSRLSCVKNGDFDKQKSSAVCYCWFIWEKGFKGDTVIKWFN